MSDIKNFNRSNFSPVPGFRSLLYKIRFARDNPDYFYPSGIWVYCGPQGSGKTLSAIRCLKSIVQRYPRCKVCTNLDIKGLDCSEIIPFTDYSQLLTLSNGVYGLVFFIDEIHVLWNSLESKEIPISEMATFCQMRKDRRIIIGTSQVYGRIAKPIREQLQYVVDCHNFFNIFQYNTLVDPTTEVEKDGHLSGNILGTSCFFHSPDLYDCYDTLFKIKKASRKGGHRFNG